MSATELAARVQIASARHRLLLLPGFNRVDSYDAKGLINHALSFGLSLDDAVRFAGIVEQRLDTAASAER